jgi:hypothetical protein
MRKEIIRTKIKEIKKNIRDFYDFIRRVEEILED